MSLLKSIGMNYFILTKMMLMPSGIYLEIYMKNWKKCPFPEKKYSSMGYNLKKTFYPLKLNESKNNQMQKQTLGQNKERLSVWRRTSI